MSEKKTRTGRVRTMTWLRRIGAYMWIGLVDPGPPRVPGSRPRKPRKHAAR
jgi:hypothetical protein